MRRLTLLVVVALAMTGTNIGRAAIIAYEGFDYQTGDSLNGLNGGSGFGDAWFVDEYSYTIGSGSLSDPSGTLQTSGNSLEHSGLLPRARRNMSTTLGATGTTAYVSFLLRQDAIGDFVSDNHDFGGLILSGTNAPQSFGTMVSTSAVVVMVLTGTNGC